MNKQNLMPQPAQPVNRITTGQLPPELAELSEEVLHLPGDASASAGSSPVLPLADCSGPVGYCSYDGDDAE